METYLMLLFAIVATVVTLLVMAGCGFLLLAMWVAMKERLWPL